MLVTGIAGYVDVGTSYCSRHLISTYMQRVRNRNSFIFKSHLYDQGKVCAAVKVHMLFDLYVILLHI